VDPCAKSTRGREIEAPRVGHRVPSSHLAAGGVGSGTRCGALVGATAAVALAYLLLQMFWQRREELAADRFAIELTADLAGTEELRRFYEENLRDEPTGRLRCAGALLERRFGLRQVNDRVESLAPACGIGLGDDAIELTMSFVASAAHATS